MEVPVPIVTVSAKAILNIASIRASKVAIISNFFIISSPFELDYVNVG